MVKRDAMRRARNQIERAARAGQDWITFATAASDSVRRVVPFDRACWHPVDPGTFLFTGGLAQNIVCSGSWLAEHEYLLDDVNKWVELAHHGPRARSLSDATNGDFLISARIRSSVEMGDPIGDEARASFVVDGTYWAAAGFIRDQGRPWFSDDEMRFLASLSPVIAEGFRRAVVTSTAVADHAADDVPGVVVLDDSGHVQSISPQAERWLIDVVEVPPASSPVETRVLQAVAARARQGIKGDANGPAPRARAQTRSGRWLLLYGTGLSGELEGRVAVIIQPAGPHEVAPLVAQAYALSEREREIARGCFQGLSTRNIALALHISPYTVQDHLKSIFDKTGTRSRAELVAQVFLEHYVPRWEKLDNAPRGWNAQAIEVKRGPS